MAGVKVGRAPKEFRLDYSSNVAEEFGLWLEDIDDYMAICKVADPREKKQLFMNLAGLELRRIVKGLVVPTSPPLEDGSAGDVYKTLTDAILAYFRPAVNTTAERHKFRKMMQRDDETVTSFVGRLRAKVELCEFASTTVDSVVNGQLRDQLVAGIKTNDIRKELLKHSKLTLADAMAKAVALETSIADSSLYECPRHLEPTVSPSVNKVSLPCPGNQSRPLKCKYCGRQHVRGKQHCPAADAKCSHCQKMSHFTAVLTEKESINCSNHGRGTINLLRTSCSSAPCV